MRAREKAPVPIPRVPYSLSFPAASVLPLFLVCGVVVGGRGFEPLTPSASGKITALYTS